MVNELINELLEKLHAGKICSDSRILEAKNLILSVISEKQAAITGPCPAKDELKESYQKLIEIFGDERAGKLFYPYIGSGLGKGALVQLLDGSVKYDFITGIGVHYFGHSHPDITSASIEAALSNTLFQGNLQQNYDSLTLLNLLIKCSGLDHGFITTSGAMANENAIKLAMQKRSPASRILAFDSGFAGRTLALSQISDKPAFREGLPSILSVDYLPFFRPDAPQQSIEAAVTTLKKYIKRYPKQHALFCCELIQGEGGFYAGSTEFFKAIMDILKEEKIAILMDEVQTFGRTSQLFAYQHFGLEEYVDMVTIGKLSQICATLFRKEWKPKPALLSQTFTNTTAAIQASYLIISTLLNEEYYGKEGKIMQLHNHFVARLEKISKNFPIKGPWGVGAMIAFTYGDGDQTKTLKLTHDLFDAGVISFTAGKDPTRVRFLVPVGAVTLDDIDQVCTILEGVLAKQSP